MSVGAERRREIKESLKAFRANKSLHKLPTTVLMERYGVSETTIRRWRRGVGASPPNWTETHKINIQPLREDPDFGEKEGRAKLSIKALAERHDITYHSVKVAMTELGVAPMKTPQGGRKAVGIMPGTKKKIILSQSDSLLLGWKRNPELNNIERRKLRARW